MAYLNKVMLIGNTGCDSEIRVTNSGRKRASFSMATSRRYSDNNGELKQQTEWHNIVAWGKCADTIEKMRIKKGTPVYVEGALTSRSWNDNSGNKRSVAEIVIENLQVLCRKEKSVNENKGAETINAQKKTFGYDVYDIFDGDGSKVDGDFLDDDLPF